MYDDPQHVRDTFDETMLSEYLLQARWAEFTELKRAIAEVSIRRGSPISVLDIGIGDARVLKHLVGIEEIWGAVSCYDGIDVAQNCVDISDKVIGELGVRDKARVVQLDAVNLQQLDRNYDAIISTWFTVGNFYPSGFSFEKLRQGEVHDMGRNDKFTRIFRQAYGMLNPGGELIIGSFYLDTEATRKKQEESYRNFGWKVVTDSRHCFTATECGWWSQRFTEQRMRDYLDFVPEFRFKFIPLDTYDYAMMARIRK